MAQKKQRIESVNKVNRWLFGSNSQKGVIPQFVVYALLIIIGFCFVYPIIFMISQSFKDLGDLLNSSISWIPTTFYTENFKRAYEVLDYISSLMQTFAVAVFPAILQMIVAAFVGYGFGRYNFFGHKFLLGLVLATFLIPSQVLVIPRYILFNQLGFLGSLLSYLVPAGLGQGLNSAIFILIFYQTYRAIPKSLVEAAQLDGAGEVKIFLKIGIPMSVSAFIITFLFSVVWYWNETFLASIYFGNSLTTLPLELNKFVASYNSIYPANVDVGNTGINEAIELAATILTILPLLIIYFIAQKWFVESVDKSGITGE